MATQQVRWLADDAVCIIDNTAWGIAGNGHTFAIGSAEEVERALKGQAIGEDLEQRLERAGLDGTLRANRAAAAGAESKRAALHSRERNNPAIRGIRHARLSRQATADRRATAAATAQEGSRQ